ncbi:TonB-dependent receptor [Massilia sp. B-10]|nr:TonB-dependent receptor [Massilia sp. B-10]
MQQLGERERITATVFRNSASGLVTQVSTPGVPETRFENGERIEAHGAEFEYERRWTGGAQLRTSYSFQPDQQRRRRRQPAQCAIPSGQAESDRTADRQRLARRARSAVCRQPQHRHRQRTGLLAGQHQSGQRACSAAARRRSGCTTCSGGATPIPAAPSMCRPPSPRTGAACA